MDSRPEGRIFSGEDVWFSTDVEIETSTEVRIGTGTTIQRRCTLNGSVRVGDSCIFAPSVFISSGTHPFRFIPHLPIREQESRIAGDYVRFDKPVWIQDDCWLGVNVVVCPGVTVGKGSILGANAVVTRDVSPYSVVAGAPAKLIGYRLNWKPRPVVDPNKEEDAPYVLSGHVKSAEGSKSNVIVVDAATPLRVALAWSGVASRGLRVRFNTARPVAIIADGVRYSVPCGVSELVFSQEPEICGDVCYCNIALETSARGATLQILRVEMITA